MNKLNALNDLKKRWQICFDSMRREGTRRVRHAGGWDRSIKQMLATRPATGLKAVRRSAPSEWLKRFRKEVNKANAPPWDEWSKRLSRMIDTWYFRPKPSPRKRRVGRSWRESLAGMERAAIRETEPKSDWEKRIHGWRIGTAKRLPSYARPRHPQKEAWSTCLHEMINSARRNSLSDWEIRLNEFVSHANRKFEDHNNRITKANRKAELPMCDNGE